MATLKEINHDSSTTLSDFYTTAIVDPDSALSVTAGAALGGSTNGVLRDFDAGTGTQTARLDERTFSFATQFRFRARLDLSGITNSNSGRTQVFDITLGTGAGFTTRYSFRINANAGDSGFTIIFFYWSDVSGLTQLTSVAMPASGDTCLEIRVISETAPGANDGQVEAYIDSASQASLSNVENETNGFDVDGTRIVLRNSANLTGTGKYDEWLVTDVAGTSLCVGALTLAAMTKPASLSADGAHIYVALLQGGVPILTKISTGLASDGSTVFDPGAGDNIGVQCGKFDADVVWVAGNFGGTDTVEKSEDAGSSFDVKDDGTFDPVTSFVVGPDSDGRVLVFADAGGSVASSSIQETIDSGTSWEEKNSGLGFVSRAVERLDINAEELITGNEAGASDNIHYSPNTGEDLEDYSTGFPTQDVTKVIVS